MGKCIVVVDFGQGKTKISAYRKEDGKATLVAGAVFNTPEAGLGEPELLQMLSVQLEKLELGSGTLFVLLPADEKNVIVGEADYPMGTSKEVANIIKNNLSSFIPDEAEPFNYDWRLTEAYPSGHGHFQIAAVKLSDIEAIHEIAERKKLTLVRADITANALESSARLLRTDKKYGLSSSDDAVALVDVGHKSAHVVILSKDRIIKTQALHHNLYRMDKLIIASLGDLKNDKNIIPELLKLNSSYTQKVSQYEVFLESVSADIIRTVKQAVSGESRYHLNAIYFTGGLYKVPGLVGHIKDSFGVPCFSFPIGDFVQFKDNCIRHEPKKAVPVADVFTASIGAFMGGGLLCK